MKYTRIFYLSLASSMLVILISFFQWHLTDVITEFLMIPIWLLVFVLFIVVTVQSLFILFKKKDWKPFFIQFVTIVIWLFVPFTQIALDIDFKINKEEREEVVKSIEQGTLKPNVPNSPNTIRLPEGYEHLSKGGGEIFIDNNGDNNLVLFLTNRGILDGFSGFVYSPNDKKPRKTNFDGDIKEIEKIDTNWYFVVSY